MIKYKLKCKSGYCLQKEEFDGWFQNIEAYEKQKLQGLINCPICGSDEVVKSLTTPSLKTKEIAPEVQANNTISTSETVDDIVVNENLKNITTILRTIKKEIQNNSTFVGDEFVSQVRSMKQGKAKEESIYGYGKKEEIQELQDEGIDIVNVPWISDDH